MGTDTKKEGERKRMKIDQSGVNHGDLQNTNRMLLLEMIRSEGICTRANLSQMTNLKQSTITYIMNDFIRWGLVRETGQIMGVKGKGRRSIGVAIDEDHYGVLGVRIRRSGFSVGTFTMSGSCLAQRKIECPAPVEPALVMKQIREEIINLANEDKTRTFLAIGAAVPGPFNHLRERIVLMTGAKGWDKINIREELGNVLDLPVFIYHDANAGAWAQLWQHRELSKSSPFVYISLGQGVGAGILINGQTLNGSIGYAGEIGHMSIVPDGRRCQCGNRGCLECYTSTLALSGSVNAVRSENGEAPLTFDEIRDRIRSGDDLCTAKFLECCDYLSIGIANIINVVNPDAIIIGDEMAAIAPERMTRRIKEQIRGRILPGIEEPLRILTGSDLQDTELYGAGIVAIRQIYKNTEQYFEK